MDYYAVFLSPQVRSWRDDAAAPTAPHNAEDGRTAKEPESVLGAYQVREAQAQFLTPAHGMRDQLNAAWDAVDGQLKDERRLRHYSPKTLQAYAGWLRKFRRFTGHTHPAELTGAGREGQVLALR